MIGLLWFVMMRVVQFLEIPSGRVVTFAPKRTAGPPKGQDNVGDMTEDNHSHSVGLRPPREPDCNSNCTGPTDPVSASRLSNVSSTDGDVHDTCDYQWFADLGYKQEQTGVGGGGPDNRQRHHHPTGIFAILASPNYHGDFTYEDLSRNIDANLAEIDMEDFRSEDINSILALPAMYCGDFRSQNHGEQAASLSHSILARFDGLESSSVSRPSTSGDDDESTDMSVCQNEPLFSPVKDCQLALPTFSVDSLDCDSYNEQELMLTCQANMNNYTIAFEGSLTKYSDDSDYHEAAGSDTTDSNSWSGQFRLRSSDSIDSSLVQSDLAYTTWSKLKRGSEVVRQRVPVLRSPAACKSQSLPNLFGKADVKLSQLNVSTDSDQCVPVYDVQSSQSTHYSCRSSDSSHQSVSLMRLFMQQKAGSGASSVAHSLSSGTLHQMHDLYGAVGHFRSADERLQYALSRSGASTDAVDQSTDADVIVRPRNPSGHGEKGSPVHLVHHHKTASGEATKSLLKRRLKSSSGTCKLFGGEAMHDDGTGRSGSPMASPIEEEDENEAMSQWSSSSVPDDGDPEVLADSCDDWTVRQNNAAAEVNVNRMSENRAAILRLVNRLKCNQDLGAAGDGGATKPTQGTQTKGPNGRPQERRSSGGQSEATAAVSSSSSGYTSVRSASTDHRHAPGGSRLNVSIASYNSRSTQIPVHVHDEAVQTSFKSEWLRRILASCPPIPMTRGLGRATSTDDPADRRAVYVCYPNYSLPDLSFLRSQEVKGDDLSKMLLVPARNLAANRQPARPHSCTSMEMLRHVDLSRIQDWDSLNVLLPKEVREMLSELRSKSTEAKEGQGSADGSGPDTADQEGPPPLPKRSISLPQGDSGAKGLSPEPYVSSKPPLPKGILRRSTPPGGGGSRTKQGPKRYSMSDFLAMQQQQEKLLLHRHRSAAAAPCDCLEFAWAQELECPLTAELVSMLGLSPQACTCRAASGSTGGHSPVANCCPSVDVDARTVSVVPQPCPQCSSNKTAKEADDAGSSKSSGRPSASPEECSHGEDCQCAAEIRNKKTVSFSSNVDVESPSAKKDAVHDGEVGSSPPGIHCQLHLSKDKKSDDDGVKEWPSLMSEDAEVAPQEFCVSPIKENTGDGAVLSTPEPDTQVFLKWQRKRELAMAVTEAVDVLNVYFGQAKDPHRKFIMGSCLQTPTTGHKVYHLLCPALFAILSDGLQPEIFNSFGHVDNSVWMVIEATARSGNCTKQMSDLVIHVNNEQALWEKRMKFNAFVFGLLNIRSLDTWFSLLGTCSGILQKHYSTDAFLQMVKTATKSLFDDLLLSLQTLSLLPFDLDLLLEIHLLKSSPTQCYSHDCLPQQPTHRDHLLVAPLCCLTTALSKSTPGVQCQCDRSKLLLHRHSCGHFGSFEICCAQQQTFWSDAALDINKDRRLRRGYSQDSAIATGSSDCSNGSNGLVTDTQCGGQSTPTKRPHSYVDCGTVWMDKESPADGQKRWSCGKLNLENLDGRPNQESKDLLVKPQNTPKALENKNKVDDGLQPFPSLPDRLPAEDVGRAKIPPTTDLSKEDTAKTGHRSKFDDAKQDTEKGSLDANIAEGWTEARDSQNNNRGVKEELYDEERDTVKMDKDDDGGNDQARFKELQMRWEILSCASSEKKRSTNANVRSKIPRLITPPKLTGKMEDSSRISMASGTSSPESNNSRSLAEVENSKPEVGSCTPGVESKKLRLPPESLHNHNRNSGKVNATVKVPGGQPAIVIRSSGDKSPLRRRASPKKMPPSSTAVPMRFKQAVSRGVGGEGQAEN